MKQTSITYWFAFGVVTTLMCHPGPARAQWAVEDAAALAQRTGIWIQEAAQWGQSLKNQVDSITNEYNIILQQIAQYETMVKNLQRIPQGLNFFDIIQYYGNQVNGLLGNANMLSFNLDQSVRQFDSLYNQVAPLTSAEGVLALRTKLLNGRMEASGMSVQVTSIKQNLMDLYTRICALLTGSTQAQGNLDHQQVIAQQNGLMQQTMATMATMQAVNARLFAQGVAENVALERLSLEAIQGAMGSAADYDPVNGKLPKMSW